MASEIDNRAQADVAPQRDDATLVVGTRGSALALWQTNWVLDRLRERAPNVAPRIETIKTQGDRTQAVETPLATLGDKGIFVAELENALLSGSLDVAVQPMQDRVLVEEERHARVDAAVHSLK
ncbi:MAG TPA: hypothetical protein VGP82_01380, partial [Ktedonobacterales bacterium]|nr:hypothetical protein [Ktedonobacterales bacterium]